ncbi:BTB/POZ domain-containing protein KCTD2-like protein [Aphelenchoides avenae]|nr:BTB/POZ domain-containing protein KCTD2-like protein [Aphelenchus avenae]
MVDNKSGNWIRLNVGGKDESGAYLIDWDPEHFRVILNFLRNGSLDTDANLPYDGLMKEAEFYGLTELVTLIGEASKEEKKPEAAECITMFYRLDGSWDWVVFYSGDGDMKEHHFLIAKLRKLEPWRKRLSRTTYDGALSLSVKSHEWQLLCTHVTKILGTAGFKLDGMSDNKWVFVKRP